MCFLAQESSSRLSKKPFRASGLSLLAKSVVIVSSKSSMDRS